MRQFAVLCLALALLFVFTACTDRKGAEESARDARAAVLASDTVRMQLTMRADYGDRVFDYVLSFAGNEKDAVITVTAPENLRDFVIRISDGKTQTEFDGVSLYMGEIAELSETPACAATMMVGAWKSGYMTDCRYETVNGVNTIAVTVCTDDTREVRTWFDRETKLPLYCEMMSEGRTVLYCSISGVLYEQIR